MQNATRHFTYRDRGASPFGVWCRVQTARPDSKRPNGKRPNGMRPDGMRPDGMRPNGMRSTGSGEPKRLNALSILGMHRVLGGSEDATRREAGS